MEENKRKLRAALFWPEFVFMALAAGGIYGIAYLEKTSLDKTLGYMVMAALGIALVGFCLRREYLDGELHYDNGEHLLRFWLAFLGGMAVAFVCVFLPVEGWPFLPVFVMLSLFSSPTSGSVAGIVLLMIPTMLGEAAVGVFFLYLLSGIVGVSLFGRIGREIKIGIPLFLSMLTLLVCETANLILPANERFSLEDFAVPVVNLIISCVLLLGLIKVFSTQVVYHYRVRYLELNDAGNELLTAFKQEEPEKYIRSVHIAHFCELIAKKLSMDAAVLKCAACYHKLAEDDDFLKKHRFPPDARTIMREYQECVKGKAVRHRETAVLLCADVVVDRIRQRFQEDKEAKPDYRKIVSEVFKRFEDRHSFWESDLTLRELHTMEQIFKEEQLYYDFLR